MASSASFSVFSDIPSSSSVGVTQDEFNAFHKIDRDFFSRLVFGLNRDMKQSAQVIAFLLLLEQLGYVRNLIAYLVSLQDDFINAVANEIAVCISILHNDDYSRFFAASNNNNDDSVIPLLLRLTGSRLTLRFISQNRETFLVGVRKNMNDICSRAFGDLCVRAERYHKDKLLALQREKVIEEMKKMRMSGQQQTPGTSNVRQGVPTGLTANQQIRFGAQPAQYIQVGTASVQLGAPSVQRGGTLTFHRSTPSVQRERSPTPPPPPPPVEEETTNKTATETNEAENEEGVLPADDRTVFLTFSKGYPISESEVMDYFTRRYGEVIEAVLMQEVDENDQPLFARMVMKKECVSKIEEIVTPRNRNKFTIDGKHVLARKFVRKYQP